MKPITLVFALYTFLNLSGCSILADPELEDWPTQRLYSEAKDALNYGDFANAIKYYEFLEARYPFGKYAQQAQLDLIYAYYKFDEPESAIVTANHFLQLYPRHPNVDYVYYLKGLVNFERNQGALARILPLDESQREQSSAIKSFYDFAELIERFPNSKYSEDARQRMIHLRNRLAEHELHVAKFYMVREAYVAAANRAKIVIQTYQRTPAVPEALVILAKAYKIMGLNELSDSTLKVLKLNHPNHEGIAEVEYLVVK
jgi:outer membrane protein assembly factor BamD